MIILLLKLLLIMVYISINIVGVYAIKISIETINMCIKWLIVRITVYIFFGIFCIAALISFFILFRFLWYILSIF